MKQRDQWPVGRYEHQISGSRIEEFTHLLPVGWPQDIPLVRVRTCGCAPLQIEVLAGFENPESYNSPVYVPPDEKTWQANATKTTLALLAYLVSQPHCYASQDTLAQALRPGRHETQDDDEDGALKRPENVVTQLRRLLYPPVLLSLPKTSQYTLRNLLVRRVMASQESGPGYILAPLPLLWLDVEVMETQATHALTLEQFGESALSVWQQVSRMGFRGIFLPHEPYSDWAEWRRGRVKDLLWQSVEAQLQAISQWDDQEARDEAALRLLGSCWQSQSLNEDAFRAFAERLGKKERFEQAENSYRQLCLALEREGRVPHERTVEIMEFVRTKKIQRAPGAQPAFVFAAQDKRSISWAKNTGDLTIPMRPEVSSLSIWPAEEPVQPSLDLQALQEQQIPFLDLQAKIREVLFSQSQQEKPLELSRRDALLTLAALAIPMLMTSRKAPAQPRVEERLAACQHGIAACWKLSHESDLLVAYETLSYYTPSLVQLVQTAPAYRKAAAGLAGQAFLLKAITGRHVANLYLAELACKEAVMYSQIAEDTLLYVIALRHLAMIFFYGKRHREELAVYERITPFLASEEIPPIVRSFIYAGLAGTQALYQRQEALYSLEVARKHFAEQPTTLPSPPFIDYDYSQILLSEGLAHYDLGAYKQALQAFLQIERTPLVLAERGKLEFLNCQALTVLHLPPGERDMEQCIAYWKTGIVGALNLKSRQRFDEACRTYELMQAVWPAEKPIRALQEFTLLWGDNTPRVLS